MTIPGVTTSTRRCLFGLSGRSSCVSFTSVGARAVILSAACGSRSSRARGSGRAVAARPMQSERGLEGEHPERRLVDALLIEVPSLQRRLDGGDIGFGIVREQDRRRSRPEAPRGIASSRADHAPKPAIPVASETIRPLKPRRFLSSSTFSMPLNEAGRNASMPASGIERAHESGKCDMRGHHAHHAGLDRRAVEFAERRLPFVERERIDGGDEMLVAIVEALARPVLHGRGDAVRLKHLDLLQGMTLDRRDVAAEAARSDDGASERVAMSRTGVNDQLMPAAAASSAMMRLTSAVASTSSTAASPSGLMHRCPDAHPAAFEIGGDRRGNRRGGDKLRDIPDLRVGIGPEDARHSTRLELQQSFEAGRSRPERRTKSCASRSSGDSRAKVFSTQSSAALSSLNGVVAKLLGTMLCRSPPSLFVWLFDLLAPEIGNSAQQKSGRLRLRSRN